MKHARTKSDEKATWKIVIKTNMPLSQRELRAHIAEDKKKGRSVTEQYVHPDMKGFQKQQVDRLLEDRNREETDPLFVYKLASLRLVKIKSKQTTRQTSAMQIILKRIYSQPPL